MIKYCSKYHWISANLRLRCGQNAAANHHRKRQYEDHPTLQQLVNTRFPRSTGNQGAETEAQQRLEILQGVLFILISNHVTSNNDKTSDRETNLVLYKRLIV